jgi:hypothetical protein
MAENRLHVFYIPGLGNPAATGQRLAIGLWSVWGVHAELVQLNWNDNENWETKFQRLNSRIEALTARGVPIALVGASAGASAVINAFARQKSHVVGCVLIAGKVNQPGTIGAVYRQQNPAFVESAVACQKSLGSLTGEDRKRILSRYGAYDEIVSKTDSHIPGARNQIVPGIRHALIIANQLIFGAPSFLRFLKATAKKN